MNRDEFEKEYPEYHMKYDPRCFESKLQSVIRLRDGDGYTDSHIDRCWKDQQAATLIRSSFLVNTMLLDTILNLLEWRN